jgi:hypothetical protein
MKLPYQCLSLALLASIGGAMLLQAAVPGSWKVVPGVMANQSPFAVGRNIVVVSPNDIWQVASATTGTGQGLHI